MRTVTAECHPQLDKVGKKLAGGTLVLRIQNGESELVDRVDATVRDGCREPPQHGNVRTRPRAFPAPANLNDALAGCRNGYPDQITQAVARAACVITATELLRPLLPFPDLLDQENKLRKSLAEQVQGGSISLLERNRQMAKFHAAMLAEEQGRLQEKPAEVVNASLAATQWRNSNPDG